MASDTRTGSTEQKQYGPGKTRSGYGFDIEKRGRGPASGEWLPVITLIYNTESDSNEAKKLVQESIDKAVAIEGN